MSWRLFVSKRSFFLFRFSWLTTCAVNTLNWCAMIRDEVPFSISTSTSVLIAVSWRVSAIASRSPRKGNQQGRFLASWTRCRTDQQEARRSSNSARNSDRASTLSSIARRCERSIMQSSRTHPRDYTTTAARTMSSGVASMHILHPVADDEILPAFLPTQPIRSSGIFCTEYSRCSDAIMQTVRFFDIISSSLSRRLPSHAEYHRSSQSQIRGLSAARTDRMEHGTK